MITITDNMSLWIKDLQKRFIIIVRSEYCFSFKMSLRAATLPINYLITFFTYAYHCASVDYCNIKRDNNNNGTVLIGLRSVVCSERILY